ncbi:SDR family oxidoreductase [Agrobacterium vitis]|uniref:SDR family NAD(P)-dependent oxidoreductase n=1 Tax=Agrobacterium vitis TaxID=373 RepID=UPI002033A588|nr:SDR family oxidoreductase [Agrobacterium vitis]MCM2438742.1 SDR family oxidoreductase [Agrobacterium vitis]
MRLDGKNAIIVGAGSGIGAATAQLFAELGARLVLMGPEAAPLAAVARHAKAEMFVGDASRRGDMAGAVALINKCYGAVDLLVNCAGGGGNAPLGDLTDEQWSKALSTNLETARISAAMALPDLTKTRGAIVFVASLAGLRAVPGATGYVAAKHAVVGLMKAIAADYGPSGIRVNAVCPGLVRTAMADAIMDHFGGENGMEREAMYARATRGYPLRRPGEPEEVARAIAFLASDWASFITGQCLVADGGGSVVDVF